MKIKIPTRFCFDGTFEVEADSVEEGRQLVSEHCGMVLMGGVHSSLPDEQVSWDFPVHPEKILLNQFQNYKPQGFYVVGDVSTLSNHTLADMISRCADQMKRNDVTICAEEIMRIAASVLLTYGSNRPTL